LGLAEDTWALNEGAIDDRAFLQHAYDIDHERDRMFSVALDRLSRGCLVCVFDATDRIQHMFWRSMANGSEEAIRDLYQHNVALGDDAIALKKEIQDKLNGLVDPDGGEVGIREVFDTAVIYSGPYVDNAPDLLIGYNAGYRTSWDCAKGIVAGPIFQDNLKAW